MIAALTGRLIFKSPSHITLDVHGVGYELFVPLSTFYALPEVNESVSLRVYTHLREDALHLYGFLTAPEKDAFVLLTSISGIGPKLALSVLSTLPISDLASAVEAADLEKLTTVPGIGAKSAGRIVLELKDKIVRLRPTAGVHTSKAIPGAGIEDDALSALVNLGYRSQDVKAALKTIMAAHGAAAPLTDVIRLALKELARG